MKINYKLLQLIDYEGAGNRTPVLDVSSFIDNTKEPLLIRRKLEQDKIFRIWLRDEGLKHRADSVMIFYNADNKDYDFVTFIGEPNSPIENEFSEMCGNGIRSLALHILLSENNKKNLHRFLKNGINIWAGSIRNVAVEELDKLNQSATISVNLGKINTSSKELAPYISLEYFPKGDLSQIRLSRVVSDYLANREVGIGFNGDGAGEPHVVLVNNPGQYKKLVSVFNLPLDLNRETIINNLREMAVCFGKRITFNSEVFPLGINFNIALVLNNIIYVSTHERNMSSGQSSCSEQIVNIGFCTCNTMACGTGGSIICAIAKRQRLVRGNKFITIHPGGEIRYEIRNNESIMTGPAIKIDSAVSGKRYEADMQVRSYEYE